MRKIKPNTPAAFFYEHAGHSWTPAKQTEEEGHVETARALALAEARARRTGWAFEWTITNDTARSYAEEIARVTGLPAEIPQKGGYHRLWHCTARNYDGIVMGSVGCVDFGPRCKPWGSPYRRVVEAELALDGLTLNT